MSVLHPNQYHGRQWFWQVFQKSKLLENFAFTGIVFEALIASYNFIEVLLKSTYYFLLEQM